MSGPSLNRGGGRDGGHAGAARGQVFNPAEEAQRVISQIGSPSTREGEK